MESRMIFLLLTVAAFFRAFFFLLRGPIFSPDSAYYMATARYLAQGEWAKAGLNPFYLMYPALLVPMQLFGISPKIYLCFLHVVLSTLTVWVLLQVGKRLYGEKRAVLVAWVAAFFPTFFFYIPYVLSENLFLLILSLFLWAFVKFLQERTFHSWLVLIGGTLLTIFARPTSVALLPVLFILSLWTLLEKKKNQHKLVTLLLTTALVVGTGVVALCQSPKIQKAILRNATVSGQLQMGVYHRSNGFKEFFAAMAEMGEYQRLYAPKNINVYELREWWSLECLKWIARNPGTYFKSVATRFFCFWFPGILQGSWSTPHVILDSLLGFSLLLGLFFSLANRCLGKIPHWTFALTLCLGLLSGFLSMDTDGRYRLPAELLLLVFLPSLAMEQIYRAATFLKISKAPL